MIRILIADDHAIMRDGLKQILAECADMQVAGEAADGNATLARVRADAYDVVVLDMSMPGRSGLDLLRQIKAEKPRLPVLILSMHSEEQYAARTIKAGAAGYLCKTSASLHLVEAIRRLAAGHMFISPAAAEFVALAMQGVQDDGDPAPHGRLSDREFEVFRMLAGGLGPTEIGERLHLSVKTVSTHKTRIMEKLGVANVAELIRYALRHRLLDADDGR